MCLLKEVKGLKYTRDNIRYAPVEDQALKIFITLYVYTKNFFLFNSISHLFW